jgi:hypothetical protein
MYAEKLFQSGNKKTKKNFLSASDWGNSFEVAKATSSGVTG